MTSASAAATRSSGIRARVGDMSRFARQQLVKTRRNPDRIRQLANPARLKVVLDAARQPATWVDDADRGLQSRAYADYRKYVAHQRWKPHGAIDRDHDTRFRTALADRLRSDVGVSPGLSVLCLGARWGTEVRAFHDAGCFAVGLDLKPGAGTDIVLQGDFHALPFPDHSVDLVYTNSLDHAAQIDRVIDEIRRVVKKDGRVLIEAVHGTDEGHPPGVYECFYWKTTDDLVRYLAGAGLQLRQRTEFDQPWAGTLLVTTPAS